MSRKTLKSRTLKELAGELSQGDQVDPLELSFSVLDRKVKRAREADEAFDRKLREAEQRLTGARNDLPPVGTDAEEFEVLYLFTRRWFNTRIHSLDAEERYKRIESAIVLLESFELAVSVPRIADFGPAVTTLRDGEGWMREFADNDFTVRTTSYQIQLNSRIRRISLSLQPMQNARWRIDQIDRVLAGWTLLPHRLSRFDLSDPGHPAISKIVWDDGGHKWEREIDFAVEVADLTRNLADGLDADRIDAETRGRSQGSHADPSPAEVQPPPTGDHDAAPRESAARTGKSPAIGGEPPSASRPGDIGHISACVKKARDQYLDACEVLGKDSPTHKAAYDVMEEVLTRDGLPSPLPQFKTWSRYLTAWRTLTRRQKYQESTERLNAARQGKSGSLVPKDLLSDARTDDTSADRG